VRASPKQAKRPAFKLRRILQIAQGCQETIRLCKIVELAQALFNQSHHLADPYGCQQRILQNIPPIKWNTEQTLHIDSYYLRVEKLVNIFCTTLGAEEGNRYEVIVDVRIVTINTKAFC
jgi:hypothetical protein